MRIRKVNASYLEKIFKLYFQLRLMDSVIIIYLITSVYFMINDNNDNIFTINHRYIKQLMFFYISMQLTNNSEIMVYME